MFMDLYTSKTERRYMYVSVVCVHFVLGEGFADLNLISAIR